MINDIQKKRLVGGIIAFLAIVSLYFVVKLINEIRAGEYIGTKDTPSTITVAGDGEVYATADIATISFTARGQGSTVKAAQEKESAIVNKAIDFLKEKGIAEKDIKTSNYNLQPQYDYGNCANGYCPTRTPKIVGYDASQTVDIKIRDINTVGDVLTGLGAAGVTELSGPNFSIDDEDKLKEDAREMAIKEAREKAEKLARDLGVDIVRVTSFQESTGGYYPMAYDSKAELQSAGAPTANPVVPAGENKIAVSVTITYEIR
ncbi:MAG: SIMPL domain-containing protein [Candidatus Pacebacteria bacterium]|nr:SIMPL domain-containing protein [Candidatus Paceibacterota bacterium]MBP9851660.1 SIMPL domain-containing protein [Candidatus Paceibacterota bacterium]